MSSAVLLLFSIILQRHGKVLSERECNVRGIRLAYKTLGIGKKHISKAISRGYSVPSTEIKKAFFAIKKC